MVATITGPNFAQARLCEPILRALPDWFGIEASIVRYAAEIDSLPTWLAREKDQAVGFVSIKQHNPYSAEIYVMGILPRAQHRGLGRALIEQAQAWLRERGVEYLQVKTLGPSRPDESYAATRAFYAAVGFRPLEEFKQIWDEHNPCLVLVKQL